MNKFLTIIILGLIILWGSPVEADPLKPKKLKRCQSTNFERPCTCENEPNAIKKKYCEIRMKQSEKMTRGDAASLCAERSMDFPEAIGAEYYKDCMKDEGF